MTLIALAALASTAHAQDTVAAQLSTSGFDQCTALSALSPFFPAEASHVYAVRLPVSGNSRFEVDNFVYSLIDTPGVSVCNGGRTHRLDVWVQDTTTPDATPSLEFTTVVTHTPSGAPNDFYEIDVPDFIVSPGEQVYVGFEMTASASNDVLCVLTCSSGAAAPVGGEHFWSNAAATPYAWSDIVTGFGLQLTPLVLVNGDLLLIDPTATIGNQVSLGQGAAVGVDAVLKDRSTIGDGAVIGVDATIGFDATVGAGAIVGDDSTVQDRGNIGADVVIGRDVTVGFDATVGAGATIDDDALLKDRSDVGVDAVIGRDVTVGFDSVVGARTSIGNDTLTKDRAIIGDDVTIGSDVTINHDVDIEDGVQIGDDSVLKDRASIGAGATLGNNVQVEIGATVAAGAVIADNTIVR